MAGAKSGSWQRYDADMKWYEHIRDLPPRKKPVYRRDSSCGWNLALKRFW